MTKDSMLENHDSTRNEAAENIVSIDERKLLLEERKVALDFELRKQELQIKERESGWASRFFSPLTTTILAGILTLAGSFVATLMQGQQTLLLEQRKFEFTKQIEIQKEQHELITKMVAVGDEKQARANLRFLAEYDLIADSNLASRLLKATTVAVLPPSSSAVQPPASGLYQQPVLIVDPGIHTRPIRSVGVDASGHFGITGSDDKTVRVWSLKDGMLLQTIRVPAGPNNVGKVFAIAINPSGDVIAAGGWTADRETTESIYFFDRGGNMIKRINGLSDVVTKLVFSSDGRYLAAATGDGTLHIYEHDKQWNEVFRDMGQNGNIYGMSFATDGHLATASYEGKVKLYGPDFKLIDSIVAAGGHHPYHVAFSPNGNVLAVGYRDADIVELLDGHTLRSIARPDVGRLAGTGVPLVVWSKDGQTLFGGGTHSVVAWSKAGHGERRVLSAVSSDTIMSFDALPDGGILVATADPALKCLSEDGTIRWSIQSPVVGLRDKTGMLAVSVNGGNVEFGSIRFDVGSLRLSRDPPADNLTARPKLEGLPIENWENSLSPTLAGTVIKLDEYERSQSLAIHPNADRFVLGTDWSLRAFGKNGQLIWRRSVPASVLGVNIPGDGRLVVAAYDDGSIRWHRMDDGQELLALMVMGDKLSWVAWTPEGFYAASIGAMGVLQWYVSRGPDAVGVSIPVSAIPSLYRPDVLRRVLQELSIERVVGLVALEEARTSVLAATRSLPISNANQ